MVLMVKCSTKKEYTATNDHWIAILTIATRLLFDTIQDRAIKEITNRLHSISPVDLVLLAYKCDVSAWLLPAFTRIVENVTTLTDSEAARLPFSDLMLIMRCRDAICREPNHSNLNYCGRCSRSAASSTNASALVRQELASRNVGNTYSVGI